MGNKEYCHAPHHALVCWRSPSCFSRVLAVPAQALATYPDDNGLIVFTAPTDAGSQLFTIRPNGRGLRQITHVAGDAFHADWSPDGRHIVFTVGTRDERAARDRALGWVRASVPATAR